MKTFLYYLRTGQYQFGEVKINSPYHRIQIYWPEIMFTKTDFYIMGKTGFRIVFNTKNKYYGFGFEILGFGFGIDKKF